MVTVEQVKGGFKIHWLNMTSGIMKIEQLMELLNSYHYNK